MATAAATGLPTGRRARRAVRSRFSFYLSLACLAVGVLGFTPTYWSQVAAGTFAGSPLLHIHGVLFTGWLLMLVGQSWRISQGHLEHHRAWGVAGVALATAIFFIGATTAIVGLTERYAQGSAQAGRTFLMAPFFSLVIFYGFFIAALANVRRPSWHMAFMFVATAGLLVPAIARFFFLARRGWEWGLRPGNLPPAPLSVSYTSILVASLIIVAGMVRDWRTKRAVHPAWVIGLVVFVAGGLLREPIAQSGPWQAFADWTTRIV